VLTVAQSAVKMRRALDGAILHLLRWSKMMNCKSYIGTPYRESGSGQAVVTVCDGQSCQPLPLRLDLVNYSPV
jgi:hypothetical protein